MLEQSEDWLGRQYDSNENIADHLMITCCQLQWFCQSDSKSQTDDDQDDVEDLEWRMDMRDFLGVW